MQLIQGRVYGGIGGLKTGSAGHWMHPATATGACGQIILAHSARACPQRQCVYPAYRQARRCIPGVTLRRAAPSTCQNRQRLRPDTVGHRSRRGQQPNRHSVGVHRRMGFGGQPPLALPTPDCPLLPRAALMHFDIAAVNRQPFQIGVTGHGAQQFGPGSVLATRRAGA